MGAWDTAPFGNDMALDFLLDCEDASDATIPLREALERAADADGYLEGPVGDEAVAAAAVLALAAGATLPPQEDTEAPLALDDEDIDAKVALMMLDEDDVAALVPLARRALDRVDRPDDSETHDLWDDAGLLPAWRVHLQAIRDGLPR